MKVCDVINNKDYKLTFDVNTRCFLNISCNYTDGSKDIVNRRSVEFKPGSYVFAFTPRNDGELTISSSKNPEYASYLENIVCEEV